MKAEIIKALNSAANSVVGGANSDIQEYAVKIADLSAKALAANRPDLLSELANQERVLGERQRLRVSKEVGRMLDAVTNGLLLVLGAFAGIKGAKKS